MIKPPQNPPLAQGHPELQKNPDDSMHAKSVDSPVKLISEVCEVKFEEKALKNPVVTRRLASEWPSSSAELPSERIQKASSYFISDRPEEDAHNIFDHGTGGRMPLTQSGDEKSNGKKFRCHD
uniref:Small kinetochore-associated protein n=1 Tax=Panagrellus redivivus TaxID=6233 RepID=A0A7E4UVN5_PANRE